MERNSQVGSRENLVKVSHKNSRPYTYLSQPNVPSKIYIRAYLNRADHVLGEMENHEQGLHHRIIALSFFLCLSLRVSTFL